MPEVSFIIINYNTFELTCKCIASIKNKVKEVSYEIILIDNASVEINADAFLEKFPDIKLIKNDVNLGFAKGNNLGISHSNGDFICLINSDASFKNGFGVSAIDLLKNSDVGFLTGKLVFPNGKVQHNCQPFPSGIKIAAQLLRIHKLFSKEKRSSIFQSCYFDYDSIGYPDWVWGTFMLFKRTTLQHFNNDQLPDTFFMYCEDIEWSYILRENKIKNIYLPEIEILHEMGGSGSQKKNNWIKTNLKKVVKNHARWYERLFLNFFISQDLL